MAKISVIVPIYCVESYLEACVESILCQTETSFDLVLIDDGSPDRCGAIADAYAAKDTRIHVIHQENHGISAARNAGIDWAMRSSDSTWLAFVDSDDLIAETFLAELLETAEREQVRFSSCGYCRFEDGSLPSPPEAGGARSCPEARAVLRNIYTTEPDVPVSAWGKLLHKSLFEDLRFPVGKLHEDQAVVPLLVYRSERVAITERKLYFYRSRPQSVMTSKFTNRRFDDLDAIDSCAAFFRGVKEPEIVAAAQRHRAYLRAMYNYFAIMDGVHDDVPTRYKLSETRMWEFLAHYFPCQNFLYLVSTVYPMESAEFAVMKNRFSRLENASDSRTANN